MKVTLIFFLLQWYFDDDIFLWSMISTNLETSHLTTGRNFNCNIPLSGQWNIIMPVLVWFRMSSMANLSVWFTQSIYVCLLTEVHGSQRRYYNAHYVRFDDQTIISVHLNGVDWMLLTSDLNRTVNRYQISS